MARERRSYSTEFRPEAVRRVLEENLTREPPLGATLLVYVSRAQIWPTAPANSTREFFSVVYGSTSAQ